MKFAHIADTHIKNLKYHYEYRKVFDKMYEILREEGVDCIVHCGDIAHTKTQISPEFVDMCSKFFRNLADIAPTYIILGNHDGNLKNSSRQDAITPIVEALDLDNVHLLKNSGEVVLDGKFCLNVLSVFDEDNWVEPSDDNKVNIALYHGSIAGVQTDVGWTMQHGDHDVEIFENHDFAFLGDIHKTNQTLDHDGRVRYCGSTVQQNHGETNDKGFLVWDIKDKDVFECTHHVLINPKPFVTVELTPRGRMPKGTVLPQGARLRLVSNNPMPLSMMRKAVDVAKKRFSPESITFLNRSAGGRGTVEDLVDDFKIEDLRDLGVQEKLIREYLVDYEVNNDIIDSVVKFNSKYNTLVEQGEEVSRNINWKLQSMEWDNLFNYGENNKIDFTNISGIVGIFGKNYSGKSSIIDSLLYTIYNSTSKNVRKNLNVINQTKESGSGKVEISIGSKLYTIERVSEKYVKKLKGAETMEAKTDINFSCLDQATGEVVVLNGTTRNDTDKNIRKLFGTLDDFLLTSMTSQLGSLAFISEGSTRRKEILAKFLDLEIFEKKFKLANEDAADLRGALKMLEGREFDDEIIEAMKEAFGSEEAIETKKNRCDKMKSHLEVMTNDRDDIEQSLAAIPAEIIDIANVLTRLSEEEIYKDSFDAANKTLNTKLLEKKDLLEKFDNFLEMVDIDVLIDKQQRYGDKSDELTNIVDSIMKAEEELERFEKKGMLLQEVPCGDKFPTCKFLQDAYEALGKIPHSEKTLVTLGAREKDLSEELENFGFKGIQKHIKKYNIALDKKRDIEHSISTTEIEIEKNNSQAAHSELLIQDLNRKKDVYEENKEAIENFELLTIEKENFDAAITVSREQLEGCEKEIMELYKVHGSLSQKVENLEEQKKERQALREEYAAYDLFMRCMHSNGIAYDVIKKKLPVINEEIAKVLANVVDFEIFFETDDRRLNIFIKHPKFEARPLENGSGAEKTIAAMAIRLALLSISSLPKPDIFILDEPGTALDAENMDGFVRILDLVKNYYNTVFLISHLDSLKDCVDMQIVIDKKDGFAHVVH
jgi:DNA repair exonuclease SbcCD ATPase subunit/DNA repair exonuclease SbcCD nuclease subunit